MADDITHYDDVEAYADRLSYAPGDTVRLHVSCRTARYDVVIHRWGATRDLVWQARHVAGGEQPTPPDADAHGCRWSPSIDVPIGTDWRSGFYLVTLTALEGAAGRDVGHACFVVRGGATAAPALLVHATNTWHAYNNWGGRSLYTGGVQVSFARPFGRGMLVRPVVERDDRKARPRYRGEEPDVDGAVYQEYRFAHGYPGFMSSAGWFTYERQFVEWAEAAGIELDHAVSSDLEEQPSIVDRYAAVIGCGHDEYWSAGQRATIEEHVRAGGNYLSCSGNTMFWQVRLVGSPGAGDRGLVCHKYRAHLEDPVMGTDAERTMTGMWADPIVGRPEAALLGAGSAWGLYNRFGAATARGSGAFTVYRDDHWLFDGTGLRYGDLLGADHGVVGYETVGCRIAFDDLQLPVRAGGDATPDDVTIVAFTPSSNLAYGEYPASIAALDDQGDLEFVAERIHGGLGDGALDPVALAKARIGNAVMVVARPFGDDGGEVVTIGSTDWVYGLADPRVSRVTRNAVQHCAQRRWGSPAARS
jgi:hypothetical protein